MLRRDPASFRDPDGFVFTLNGDYYRSLTPAAKARLLEAKAFYSAGVERGLLLPFKFDTDSARSNFGPLIKPDSLELITYPHEWCFEQLKDAALTTLDLNLLALEYGYTLKDASAFNLQRHHGKMVFIDHPSFEETDGKLPWRPYSQFCRHFLNPLVVGSYRDIHASAFFRMNLDGLAQQTANDLLPWRARFIPSVAIHMLLHNRFIRRSSVFEEEANGNAVAKRGSQRDLLRQLRAFIGSLNPATPVSAWANYYSHTNYDEPTFARKQELIAALFQERRIGTIWDIGANDGTFSRIVASSADTVLALDLDHNAVNAGYVVNRELDNRNVHALVYDICNPTPALGFQNTERPSLESRSRADAIMALAVIHHLAISNNIPLDRIADYFADRGAELIIEFVGSRDSQVRRLLAQKNTSYDWYTEDNFQEAFSRRFYVESRQEIPGTHRCIYRLVRLQ